MLTTISSIPRLLAAVAAALKSWFVRKAIQVTIIPPGLTTVDVFCVQSPCNMANQAKSTMNSHPAWCTLACLPCLEMLIQRGSHTIVALTSSNGPPFVHPCCFLWLRQLAMCSKCLWQSKDSIFQMLYPTVQSTTLDLLFPGIQSCWD